MAVAEREVQGNPSDFSFLKEMRGVREALEKGVKGKFGTLDLGMLERATPEDQKKIVGDALTKAGEEYRERQYGDKLKQVEQVLEAYKEGRLTLPGLLQGLELRPKEGNGHQSPLDELFGFFEKVRASSPFSRSKKS